MSNASDHLDPGLTRHETEVGIALAREYLDSLAIGEDPPNPDIADSDGLVTYINGSTNPPPPPLVEERTKLSAILEGLTGIVTAAVLRVSDGDEDSAHDPKLWGNIMANGLGPFMAGLAQETVEYDRRVKGIEVATEFLNILMDAVTQEGGALDNFKGFLQRQGDAIRLHGENNQENYRYACIGMVHEIFEIEPGTWAYVPKIRTYFTSFTRETFEISAGCVKYEEFRFRFKVEKKVMAFKIETWRQEEWFRKEVNDFIQRYTKANIRESENFFDGIFKSAKPS